MSDTGAMSTEVDPVEAALRQAMHAEPLPEATLRRIHAATESEWRAHFGAARSGRHWRLYASAASVALLVLAGGWMIWSRDPDVRTAVAIGRLERSDYPGAVAERRWSQDLAIANGDPVRIGQRIHLQGAARIALNRTGSLRLAAGTEIEITSDRLIRLTDGDMYVDISPEYSRETELAVQTPAGTFTHLGTQFQLAVHEGETQLRVREGQVRWHSAAGDVLSGAGAQLSIDRHGNVTRSIAPTSGSAWAWAEALADTFDIEDRPLADFLHHVARETGRTLAFSDPTAQRRAQATILHGSMQGLSSMEALAAVMATTSLRFSVDRTDIRIESSTR